jgi:hypothetical protein
MDPDLCNGLIIPLHQSSGIISKSVDFLESNNILGETQGAFRKDRRIEDQIFSLQGIASLYKSSRKPLYLAFFIIISPPYFRNSFGISSIPGTLPILRLFKAFVIDSFVKTIENILSSLTRLVKLSCLKRR